MDKLLARSRRSPSCWLTASPSCWPAAGPSRRLAASPPLWLAASSSRWLAASLVWLALAAAAGPTFAAAPAVAATPASTAAPAALKPYISEDSPVLVLNHVRVIDGTGAAPVEDQRVDIADGKIVRVQSAKLRNAFPAN